jgi:hypothetical protein
VRAHIARGEEIWADISHGGRIIRWDYPPHLTRIIPLPRAATTTFWERGKGYKYPSPSSSSAAGLAIEETLEVSHQKHKIFSLNPPKLLIFRESKEKALIYILTEAI